jgi:hypothetical protein
VTGEDITSADVPSEVVDEVSVVELQALRPRTSDAAQAAKAAKATEDDMREEFTTFTLHPGRLYSVARPSTRPRLVAGFG